MKKSLIALAVLVAAAAAVALPAAVVAAPGTQPAVRSFAGLQPAWHCHRAYPGEVVAPRRQWLDASAHPPGYRRT